MSTRGEAEIPVAGASAGMRWTEAQIPAALGHRAAFGIGTEMPHPCRERAAISRHRVSATAGGVRVADTGTGRFGVLLSTGPSGRGPRR